MHIDNGILSGSPEHDNDIDDLFTLLWLTNKQGVFQLYS